MSTSATQSSEVDIDIHNTKKKKLRNGCRYPQLNYLKRMSTSAMITKVNFDVYQ